jgi:hypothetical protein
MSGQEFAADLASWHDNLVYGMHLRCADPVRDLWRSELVLDIDHIVEWVPQRGGGMRFRMAPAMLVFHDVSDLKLAIDFGCDVGYRRNLNELSIDRIDRQPIAPDEPGYYRWEITLNLPAGGQIAFVASGYTQTLTAAPQLCSEQRFPAEHRPPFILGA